MKFGKYIFIYIMVLLLISCTKKKENNSGNIQQKEEQTSLNKPIIKIKEIKNVQNGPATEEEKEAMKELIYKNDKYVRGRGIFFIERTNFGIPGGENWIIELNENEEGNKFIFIYVINDDEIVKNYDATVNGLNFLDRNPYEISEYDIMRDIPGTHIPDGVNSFGDFNGDGIVELFKYIYSYLVHYNIDIFYYDSKKEGFINCRIPFKLIDPKNGPAPVEFMTYQGMLGFKVYNEKYHWETETIEEGKWYFYTWDTEQREYVEIGEVVE